MSLAPRRAKGAVTMPEDASREATKGSKPSVRPPRRIWMGFLLILVANFAVTRLFFPSTDSITVPYTAFKEEIAKGNVASIYSQGASIEGRFKAPVTWPPASAEKPPQGDAAPILRRFLPRNEPRTASTFDTTLPAFVDPGLEAFLIAHDVEISAVPIKSGSSWATLLYGFGPAILIIAFYVWMFRRAAGQGGGMGGLMGIGRSKARRYDEESAPRVTFEDVAGIDEAENELVEIVEFLKDPKKYTRLGGTAPKGVLLVGAPRVGWSRRGR